MTNMRMFNSFLATALLGLSLFVALPVWADGGASVIMYHRFGENNYPTTNVRSQQFDAHMAELTSGKYSVVAIPEIIRRLKSGEPFLEKTVGITIDDAYLSVYTEAWPKFKKAGLPITIFVATDPIDRKFARYMSWDQLREMAQDPLVTIGSQTASHLHMIDNSTATNAADLAKSAKRLKAELGHTPTIVAYPYGEFDDSVVETALQAGFTAGFGQHSGAFGAHNNIMHLPRFAMNENYGDIPRLKTAASALPIPTTDFGPNDTVIDPANNPPLIGFTVAGDIPRVNEIACYSNHEGRLMVEHLGPRIEVRMRNPLPQGRTRLNCTMPTGTPGEDRFRWLGRLFYVKR